VSAVVKVREARGRGRLNRQDAKIAKLPVVVIPSKLGALGVLAIGGGARSLATRRGLGAGAIRLPC